jgi:hypothetical protein
VCESLGEVTDVTVDSDEDEESQERGRQFFGGTQSVLFFQWNKRSQL